MIKDPKKINDFLRNLDSPPEKRLKIETKIVQFEETRLLDSIPHEILQHILRFLDHESILNALLVNRLWNNLITDSSEILSKISLRYQPIRNCSIDALRKSQRNYRVIEFLNVQKRVPAPITACFSTFDESVKTVKIRNSSFMFGLIEELNHFPNVEKIHISDERVD